MAVRAAASPRTLKAMMRALEAAASVTSDSVRPPTPDATTLTATSPVDRPFSASRRASTLPPQQIVARIGRPGKAQHHPRNRRACGIHRLSRLVEQGTHSAELLAD